jgi:hypothetical protein
MQELNWILYFDPMQHFVPQKADWVVAQGQTHRLPAQCTPHRPIKNPPPSYTAFMLDRKGKQHTF